MEFQLAIKHVSGEGEEALVPPGVVEIGAHAFRGMRNLKRVVLPESCTAIGDAAFEGCRELEQILLPDSLASLGSFAFKNCTSLAEVKLPPNLLTLPKQTFAHCIRLEEVEGSATLQHIGMDAFSGCQQMRFFDAAGAQSIGDRAFSGCSALEAVRFSDNLKRIGRSAFRSCANLKDIRLPDDLDQLDANIFAGCREIRIHASEKTIRSFPDAFPRAVTLAQGIIRSQDLQALSAQFKINHADDAADLQQRRDELAALSTTLQNEAARLGVMDLKQRDAAIAQLEEVHAELREVADLLAEIEHPGMASLIEEFAGTATQDASSC